MKNLKRNRREFLKITGLGLASAGILPLQICKTTITKKPNIIVILCDDLGYGDLGCYGQQQIQTPNIDQLAAEGIRFTQHYAGSTVCAPSRACLMTGLHTGHVSIRGNREIEPMGQYPLAEEEITIAELLKSANYKTGLIGKWGLGHPGSAGIPNKKGFDDFFGYLCQRHAHNYYPEFLYRNENRIHIPGNKIAEPRPDGAGVAFERNEYSHDLFIKEAVRFIHTASSPFFLTLTLTIPHANNEANENGMEVPDLGRYAEMDWPDVQKAYAAMISRMDRDVGKIIEQLKLLGMNENTLVIFSSDNGPHKEGGAEPEFFNSNGPLRGIKRDLYEGGIRVPLIMRWPDRIKPGTISDHISAFWDIMPTFAEVASVEMPENKDGISLLPTLVGKPETQRRHNYLYWEYPALGGRQAIRKGPWKAVRLNVSKNRNAPIQLFNLEQDIAETKDIANAHPDIIAEMKALFAVARSESEIFKLF